MAADTRSDLVVRMVYGAELYGIQTPDGDHDFLEVFVPPLRDLLLGRAARSTRICITSRIRRRALSSNGSFLKTPATRRFRT